MMKRLFNPSIAATYLFCGMVAFVSYPVLLVLFVPHVLWAGVASLLVGTAANWVRVQYVMALAQRASDDNGVVWDVEVDSVKVGTIKDSEYAALKCKALENVANYIAQFMNVLGVVSAFTERVVIMFPLALFWGGLAAAVLAPDQLMSVVAELEQGGVPALEAVAKGTLLALLPLCIVALLGASFALSVRFGFANRFGDDVDSLLRRRFGVVAVGRVSLLRWVRGAPVFYDERGWVRRSRQAAKRDA